MLETVLGSKVKLKVLRALASSPVREMTLQDVASRTGLSHGSLLPALRQLAHSRIVVSRLVGRSHVYRLNRRHHLAAVVEEAFQREREGLEALAKTFVRGLDKRGLRAVLLFGSVARGDVGSTSDIDVLVVVEDRSARGRVARAASGFLEEHEAPISLTFLTPHEARKRARRLDPFLLTVLREGKLLHGDTRWLQR